MHIRSVASAKPHTRRIDAVSSNSRESRIALSRNWDEYYSTEAKLDFSPVPLLVDLAGRLPSGCALDLACGTGRNAIYLAKLGWRVTAIDSSPVAIRILREHARSFEIDARVADLERGEFLIAPDTYDLVCDFNYLQRDLFDAIRSSVKPGGTFIGSMYLRDSPGGPRNPAYRLNPGELREEFNGWKILYYSEAGAASIVARKA